MGSYSKDQVEDETFAGFLLLQMAKVRGMEVTLKRRSFLASNVIGLIARKSE